MFNQKHALREHRDAGQAAGAEAGQSFQPLALDSNLSRDVHAGVLDFEEPNKVAVPLGWLWICAHATPSFRVIGTTFGGDTGATLFAAPSGITLNQASASFFVASAL